MDEKFSIQDVYKLVNDTRIELITHILRLESKFDLLEAGRVTNLETKVVQLQAEHDPIKKLVYGLVSLILIAVVGALLALVIMQ